MESTPTRSLLLQVRIDGEEGWIREPDFARVGLTQAG